MTEQSAAHTMANLRDLGGLQTEDGLLIRRGRLFRSELPVNRGQLFTALSLWSVVDLRRPEEITDEQRDWPSCVQWHSTPVVAGAATPWKASYKHYFSEGAPGLADAIQVLTDIDEHPALFHCASGKDRTGIVAAMLLSLLGVTTEQIVEDYLATREGLPSVLDRLKLLPQYADSLTGWVIEDHAPRADRMYELLDWLGGQGGVQGWLLERKFDETNLPRFREAMLVDPAE